MSTVNVAGPLARIAALSLLSAPAWAGQCEGPILLA
jgi:two-component system sensor histidine kinase EvgS